MFIKGKTYIRREIHKKMVFIYILDKDNGGIWNSSMEIKP